MTANYDRLRANILKVNPTVIEKVLFKIGCPTDRVEVYLKPKIFYTKYMLESLDRKFKVEGVKCHTEWTTGIGSFPFMTASLLVYGSVRKRKK